MIQYTVGFFLDPLRGRVLLIRKKRPAWAVGRLNGVGGKLEPGELPVTGMRREFREEAGLDLPESRWRLFLVLHERTNAARVHFFVATAGSDDEFRAPTAMTDEPLVRARVAIPPRVLVQHASWALALAVDPGSTSLPVLAEFDGSFTKR